MLIRLERGCRYTDHLSKVDTQGVSYYGCTAPNMIDL